MARPSANENVDLYARFASQINHEFDARDRPGEVPEHDKAVYRCVYVGMQIHGLPTPIKLGDVGVRQLLGPLMTHRTALRQRSGYPLIFDKSMDRAVPVGHGQWLTLCEVEFSSSRGETPTSYQPFREKVESAVGALAATLDERVGHRLLAEDLVLLLDGEPVAVQDIAENVRHFLPYSVTDTERRSLNELSSGWPESVELGLRWYLRGAQAGPGKDGVLFHWIAVEAIVGRDHPKAIEAALIEVGWDLGHQALSVREIAGIRGRIAHATERDKPLTSEQIKRAYYDLEAMARALLRRHLDIESTWPPPPDVVMFEPPWDQAIGETWSHPPAVVWHEPPLPAIEGESIRDLEWTPVLPPSEAPVEIRITGGKPQEQHRVRRWTGMAVTFFGATDPLDIEIRRLPDEADARVDADRIVIAPRFVLDRDPVSELRLGLRVHVFVASHLLYSSGVPTSTVHGRLLHGVLGGWARHRVFVVENELDERAFTQTELSADSDLLIVGEHIGALAAGGTGGEEIVKRWMALVDLDRETSALIHHLQAIDAGGASGQEMLARLVSMYHEIEAEASADG